MIFRNIFIGFYKNKDVKLNDNCLANNVSVAFNDNMIILYFESQQNNINPNDVLNCDMIEFPNSEKWVKLIDIFHYSKPLSAEHWARKVTNKSPIFMINYLKDDMVSSYIYYHYLYQEQKMQIGDKYGVIYIYNNMLVMYLEDPVELEDDEIMKLYCNPSPENWTEMMNQHFQIWEDGYIGWKKTDSVCKF